MFSAVIIKCGDLDNLASDQFGQWAIVNQEQLLPRSLLDLVILLQKDSHLLA